MRTTFKMDALIALFSGIALVFAFSPTHIVWLAIIAPAALYVVLKKHQRLHATQLGFIFGLGFFGAGVSWVFVSIYYFGGTTFLISALLTILFVLVLSGLFALLGFILQTYFPNNTLTKALLVYPALWALLEALRASLFTGFPWLLLGHTTVDSIFSGLPPVFGVYGTSFCLVLISGLVVFASTPHAEQDKLHGWQLSNLSLFALVLMFAAMYGLGNIKWSQPTHRSLTVSLIQGNIPQNLRWNADQVHNILNTYQTLTENHQGSNLIIWPEGAVPMFFHQAHPFLHQIEKILAPFHSTLVTGIPYEKADQHYNAVVSLGDTQGIYLKRHLVPFGEYVPLEKTLRGLIQFFNLPMSDFLAGPLNQPLMRIQGFPVGIYLCYEVAYGQVVRSDLPNAQLLMTLTDDAWFGHSLAPWQHLQIGQFVSLETGRPMLFVGNNGITAIITASGRLRALLPQFTMNVLDGVVTPYSGTTPWVRFGDTPYLLIMLAALALCYMKSKKRKY